jgi:hypothetical protein
MVETGVVAAYGVGKAQDADILPGPSLPGYPTTGTLTYGQDHDGNAFSCDVPVEINSFGGIVWYEIEGTDGCPTMIARDDAPVKAKLYVGGNLVCSGRVMPDSVQDSSVQELVFILGEGQVIGVLPGLQVRLVNVDRDNDGVVKEGWGNPYDRCPDTQAFTEDGCPKEGGENTGGNGDGVNPVPTEEPTDPAPPPTPTEGH